MGRHDSPKTPPENSAPARNTRSPEKDPLELAYDPKKGLRGFSPRVEGGTADEAMGQAGGRVVGVLKDIGIIVITEDGFQVASFWSFVTKGDDAAKAAATATRGAGEGAVGLKGVDFEDYITRQMGGSGNFKAPNGHDIDGILPDGR